jgi:hypothetical protein
MRELLRTNDVVLLSFAEALLRDAGIMPLVADTAVSAMEGSIGILPRRMLVADDDIVAAVRLLTDADLGAWIVDDARR